MNASHVGGENWTTASGAAGQREADAYLCAESANLRSKDVWDDKDGVRVGAMRVRRRVLR